ncbi:aspartate/glutamate racemase family protein [Lacrimispora sp.]|uniref:aspartate/glutamate racemase family protein n=1 Tax=Lacrimispora sp. TaxID=2719234 RepID=UPI002FD89EE3
MAKKVAVIHTSMVTYESLNSMIRNIMPEVEVMNIVDDRLLPDVRANDGLNEDIVRRICGYGMLAEGAGANLILNACSSVGEAADVLRNLISIPCLKIDEPMAELAVEQGCRVAVFGTVKTTLEPSTRLIRRTACEKGKEITVDSYLCQEAFEALTIERDQNKHNALLKRLIREKEKDYDVLVLAQASMAVLIPELKDIEKPILNSPDSGVQRVKEMLEALEAYEG